VYSVRSRCRTIGNLTSTCRKKMLTAGHGRSYGLC
jgi:hypothetical protein